MIIEEINKDLTIEELISSLGSNEGFYLLDSGVYGLPRSRYSFIGFNPKYSIYSFKGQVFLEENNTVRKLNTDFFSFLKEHIEKRYRPSKFLPFCSGLMGYITYDFGLTLEKLRKTNKSNDILNIPQFKFNYYSEILVYDHKENIFYYTNEEKNNDWKEKIENLKKVVKKRELKEIGEIKSSFSYKKYEKAILKTKEYIELGDIYQANISQRFFLDFEYDPKDFYLKLRTLSPAPFGAYLKEKNYTIVCNSPERFLFRKGSYIETCPIKGTRKRYFDYKRDKLAKKELKNSEKDKAEHLMIVDLERNDLGKICEIGTVKVKKMFSIESYANVHHMVSTVYGKLKKGFDVTDCLKATFPGGSITGAPKIRSMEIIDELEPVKRGVYCGSIGYIDNSGNFDFNIAIRTGVITNKKLYFYVGGGIVADSQPDLEYEETITKAKAFLSALNLTDIKE